MGHDVARSWIGARQLRSVPPGRCAMGRDLAEEAGITERAAGSIVRDLEDAGYLTRIRTGRRNRYVVHLDRPFRHPAEAGHDVGDLITVFS